MSERASEIGGVSAEKARMHRCARRWCRGRIPHSRLVHWFGWVRR